MSEKYFSRAIFESAIFMSIMKHNLISLNIQKWPPEAFYKKRCF